MDLAAFSAWMASHTAAGNLVAWNSTLAYQIPLTFASEDVGSPAPMLARVVSAHQTPAPCGRLGSCRAENKK